MKSVNNFLQWTVFVCIIPLFTLIIVFGTVLHFAGVDVIGKTKEVVEYFEEDTDETENLHAELEEIKNTLNEKKTSEKKLQSAINAKDKEIEKYKLEISALEKQLADTYHQEQLEMSLIKSYELMSPVVAAKILTELSNSDYSQVIRILRGLKPDILAQVLENMKPEDAAEFTKDISK